MTTEFDKQCSILAELWIGYRQDDNLRDFFLYNDLGLPLAYAITEELAVPNQETEIIVSETWDMFTSALDVSDSGFTTLDEVLEIVAKQ